MNREYEEEDNCEDYKKIIKEKPCELMLKNLIEEIRNLKEEIENVCSNKAKS